MAITRNIMKVVSAFALAASLTCFIRNPLYAATNSQTLDFEAFPAQHSKVDHTISSYFLDKVLPGKSQTETLVLKNDSSSPITVQCTTVGSKEGMNGGIDYLTTPEHTWITGLPKQITVPQNGIITLPFHINVPIQAAVGDHVYGISLTDHPASSMGGTNSKDMSVQLNEQIRRVVAVQITVPGPTTYGVNLQKAEVVNQPSGAYLTISGLSQSNVIQANLTGKIDLLKNGHVIWSAPIHDLKLLPGEPFQLSYRWLNGAPAVGEYTATIDLSGDQIGQVHSNLKFNIKADTLASYQKLTGQKTVQAVMPGWVYPVAIGLGILLIVAAFLFWFMYKRYKTAKRKIMEVEMLYSSK